MTQEKETIDKLKKVTQGPSLTDFKNPPKNVIFAWKSLESEHYNKGHIWYIGLFVFMAVGVVFGLLTGSWTTVVVFILLSAVMVLFAHEPPKEVETFITTEGVYVHNTFFEYNDLLYYWFYDQEDDAIHKIGFMPKRIFQIAKEVLLHDVDSERLRKVLSQYAKEKKDVKETWMHKLSRNLKL